MRDASDIDPIGRFVITTRTTDRPAGLITRALAVSTPRTVAGGIRRSVPGRLPLLLPAPLLAPLLTPLGWRGTYRLPRGPVTDIAIRLSAFLRASSALVHVLSLSTAMFSVLLVLQIGALLVRRIAGSAPPGPPWTAGRRRTLRWPTEVRPRSVLARLPTPPGSGLGLLATLPPPALALMIDPRRSLRLPAIGVIAAGYFLLRTRFGWSLSSGCGPATAATAISGALGSLVVLPSGFRVVSFVRCLVAIVVFQKGVSPHQNRRGASHCCRVCVGISVSRCAKAIHGWPGGSVGYRL